MYDSNSPSFQQEHLFRGEQQSQSAVSIPATVERAPFGAAALAEFTSDPHWTLVEEGFTLAREHEIESLFAIANGYVGNRGSLAEGSPLSAPATFIAGVYEVDSRPDSVPGFFVLPDWTGVRAWIEDQPLSMDQGQILDHRRILDMRRGTLWREWRHRDPQGRITRILSFRLTSLADRHLLLQSVVFTPENYSGEMRLETSIELQPHVPSSPPPEEWKARRSATRPNVLPLVLQAPGTNVIVAFGAASQVVCHEQDAGHREIEISERRITESFHLDVDICSEYRLDRLVSIHTSRDVAEPAQAVLAHIHQMLPAGVRKGVRAHESVWRQRWHDSDIQIDGDPATQKALRFAGYHLISAANPEDERVSIGARALTGESYKGHVFWDTELYMVPYYNMTHPDSARALLMYRYHTLPEARKKAQTFGYRGAMYPWESADTGAETTPRFVIGPNGKVIAVHNGEMEVHITADIAFAVWQYWMTTGDDAFYRDAGAEIMLETARFWASRGRIEEDGRYHIRNVIGPDEYHENVDDNEFTNLMASWSMRRAVETAQIMRQRWPRELSELEKRLQLSEDELQSWGQIAGVMYTSFDPKTLLFEQFSGYFQRDPIDLNAYEPRNAAMDVILGHERIQGTNVVKQADVVMAMYLLSDQFPAEVRETNFRYYEARTGHGSSLSPAIHALMAARMGNMTTAERYLRQAAEIDLGNNMGNAAGGVHAAAIGGLWQAVVFGIAGTYVHSNALSFDPHLLPQWTRLSFPLQFRGCRLDVTVRQDSLRVEVREGSKEVDIVCGSHRVLARPGSSYTSALREKWGPWREDRIQV